MYGLGEACHLAFCHCVICFSKESIMLWWVDNMWANCCAGFASSKALGDFGRAFNGCTGRLCMLTTQLQKGAEVVSLFWQVLSCLFSHYRPRHLPDGAQIALDNWFLLYPTDLSLIIPAGDGSTSCTRRAVRQSLKLEIHKAHPAICTRMYWNSRAWACFSLILG